MEKPKIAYCHMGAIPVNVGVAFTDKEFNAELKRLGETYTYFTGTAVAKAWLITSDRYYPNIIIAIDAEKEIKRDNITTTVGLITHEATHAWQFACESIGEPKAGVEIEAYYIQWITEFVLNQYLERKKNAEAHTRNTKSRSKKTTKRRAGGRSIP